MKKIIAAALMATSLGAMASPSACLVTWAKLQAGIDGKTQTSVNGLKETFTVAKWGKRAYFKYHHRYALTMYKMAVDNNIDLIQHVQKGPWDCHCSVWTQLAPSPNPNHKLASITGICGRA